MSISLNINKIKKRIPGNILLIIVSKKQSEQIIKKVYESGQKTFGESRVQELVKKYPQLPKDISWHMIGHLQTNKVKYIAPFIHTIHSVDSLKLLKKINSEAQKHNRVINCLLQIHIAQEFHKYGYDYKELDSMLSQSEHKSLTHISLIGVMGMATFTDEMTLVRAEFKKLKTYFNTLKSNYFMNDKNFKEISMGMSRDYKIAIEEGATMIRVGSLIFNK